MTCVPTDATDANLVLVNPLHMGCASGSSHTRCVVCHVSYMQDLEEQQRELSVALTQMMHRYASRRSVAGPPPGYASRQDAGPRYRAPRTRSSVVSWLESAASARRGDSGSSADSLPVAGGDGHSSRSPPHTQGVSIPSRSITASNSSGLFASPAQAPAQRHSTSDSGSP